MRRLRFFILGPIIIAMAFTLPWPLMVLQIVMGVVYTALGFIYIERP